MKNSRKIKLAASNLKLIGFLVISLMLSSCVTVDSQLASGNYQEAISLVKKMPANEQSGEYLKIAKALTLAGERKKAIELYQTAGLDEQQAKAKTIEELKAAGKIEMAASALKEDGNTDAAANLYISAANKALADDNLAEARALFRKSGMPEAKIDAQIAAKELIQKRESLNPILQGQEKPSPETVDKLAEMGVAYLQAGQLNESAAFFGAASLEGRRYYDHWLNNISGTNITYIMNRMPLFIMTYASLSFEDEYKYIYALRLETFQKGIMLNMLSDANLLKGKNDAKETRNLITQAARGVELFQDEAAMEPVLQYLKKNSRPPKDKSGKVDETDRRGYHGAYIKALANIYSLKTMKQIAAEIKDYLELDVIKMIKDFEIGHQQTLRELWNTGTPAFKGNTAMALAMAGKAEWKSEFEKALKATTDAKLQVCLNYALARLGQKEKTESLFALLNNPDNDVQNNAVAALGLLQMEGKLQLSSTRFYDWARAKYAAKKAATPDTIYLIGKLTKPDQKEIIDFLFAILPPKKEKSQTGMGGAFEMLFAGRDEQRIKNVVDALVSIGGPQVMAEVKKRLSAMQEQAKKEQPGASSEALWGPEAECCIRVLCGLGNKADKLHALSLAAQGDTAFKRACIVALAEKADKELFEKIADLVKKDNDLKFVGALVLVGGKGDRTLLEQLMPDNDPIAKAYLQMLMGNPAGLEVIDKQIRSNNIDNVLRATTMAAQLADERLLPALQYAADYANGTYEPYDLKVRKMAWNGISKIYAKRLAAGGNK
ncbi:hypothetical protein AAU61_12730 [Desulfocarbo indianensis]|nr:hypothetical protein AAU61_12730 [Desulfocarbo indianensis]